MAPEGLGPIDAKMSAEELARQFDEVLRPLTEPEREILFMRYGVLDGYRHTVDETAGRFGLTSEEVREIEASALRKLRRTRDDGQSGALEPK